MNKYTPWLILVALLSVCSSVHASIITVATLNSSGGGSASGTTFTLLTGGLTADGVDFTARLTGEATGGNIGSSTAGIGVINAVVNGSETLDFSVTILSQTGGTVNFDGFTQVDTSAFGTNDSGLFNGNSVVSTDGTGSSVSRVFDLTPAPFSTPSNLEFAAGATGNGYRINRLSLQFTGTPVAVPEPGTLVLSGVAASLGSILYRRRRRRTQLTSAP